jgi:DNA helicase II / ATP-dependent DNA helicase PcrA
MGLSAEALRLIAEEERILSEVLAGLKAARGKSRLDLHDAGLRMNQLRDEAASARAEDLPALFDQLNNQRALIEQVQYDELPDERSPYFAHMQLEENGRLKDILLGYRGFLDVVGAPVNDWRNAPRPCFLTIVRVRNTRLSFPVAWRAV